MAVRIPLAACKTLEESRVFFHIICFPCTTTRYCIERNTRKFPHFPKTFRLFSQNWFFCRNGFTFVNRCASMIKTKSPSKKRKRMQIMKQNQIFATAYFYFYRVFRDSKWILLLRKDGLFWWFFLIESIGASQWNSLRSFFFYMRKACSTKKLVKQEQKKTRQKKKNRK